MSEHEHISVACWCGFSVNCRICERHAFLRHGERYDEDYIRDADGKFKKVHIAQTLTAERLNAITNFLNDLMEKGVA